MVTKLYSCPPKKFHGLFTCIRLFDPRYWKDIATRAELMEPVRDTVVMETLEDELRLVAADAVSEMVNDYFREKEVVMSFGILYEEVSEHLIYGVVSFM